MTENLDLVSGSKSLIVQSLPALLVLIAAAGAGLALWIRARKPEIYSGLTRATP